MVEDAKQENTEMSSSDVVDAAFAKVEGEQTPSDSSAEEKAEETETSEPKEPSAEDEKTEKPEEKEVEVPKEFHKHPAWQRILSERNEARQKQEELGKKYSDFESKLERFEKVTSSPAYIKSSMQAEGYTQEAINQKLQELGHQVEAPQQDDVKLILRELKIDPNTLTTEGKDYINTYVADAAKVADIIIRDRLQKYLPQELGTIKEQLGSLTQATTAEKIIGQMRSSVEKEGILDFSKDVEPLLGKFLDENPKATQQDVFNHFKDLNHQLTVQVLTQKGKKDARNETKKSLRQNKEGATLEPGELPRRQDGQSIGAYTDSLLDAAGIKW